jgi:hypothetical protein
MRLFNLEHHLFSDGNGGSCHIRVDATDTGVTVKVGDYVANIWEETYDTVALAMARVAVLIYCAENNFDLYFMHDTPEFAVVAQTFFSECAQ